MEEKAEKETQQTGEAPEKEKTKKKKSVKMTVLFVLVLAALLCGVLLAVRNLVRLHHQLDLGSEHLQTQDFEQAVGDYIQALSLDAENEEAYEGLARAYAGEENYENALATLKTGMEKVSGGANQKALKTALTGELDALERTARALADAGKLSESSSLYNLVLSYDPERGKDYSALADVDALQNEYETAVDDLEKGIDALEDNSDEASKSLVADFTEQISEYKKPVLMTGRKINAAIRRAAGGEGDALSIENAFDSAQTIVRTDTAPEDPASCENVAAAGIPVYLWSEDGGSTVNWYSEAETIRMNEDSTLVFANLTGLASVDLAGIDTGDAVYMSGMFWGDESLTDLDVSNFDTSAVTYMNHMFDGCGSLTSLDVTGFDTSSVVSMQAMFEGCRSLTALDVTGFDTGLVTDMSGMFWGDEGLTELDVSGFDTSSVTNMAMMFCSCSGLTSLDVSDFDTSSVTSMAWMFMNCSGLTGLDVSGFDTALVTDMSYMFGKCAKLTELATAGFDTARVTTMEGMFFGCKGLKSLEVNDFDTSSLTNMDRMFQNCSRTARKTVDRKVFGAAFSA